MNLDESPGQMEVAQLAERCAKEFRSLRQQEVFDESYCLELFRRALNLHEEQAWTHLQQRFSEIVRVWLRSHPSSDLALQRDSEENYVALTFARFWQAMREHPPEFLSLKAVLSYLHATLNGVVIDTIRSFIRKREVPLPAIDSADEPLATEPLHDQLTWEAIQGLLPDAQEQRVAYLLYYCGLKPREIISRCPGEFADVREIYRLNHNLVDRLRRNRERLRWLLGNVLP